MGQIRKRYPPTFKAKVVLEMLKETKSLTELASEYGVHTTQLHRWRQEVLEKLPQLFAREARWETERARQTEKIEALYTEIGRLSTQLNWLKKKGCHVDPE